MAIVWLVLEVVEEGEDERRRVERRSREMRLRGVGVVRVDILVKGRRRGRVEEEVMILLVVCVAVGCSRRMESEGSRM